MPAGRYKERIGRFRIFGETSRHFILLRPQRSMNLSPTPAVYFESCLDLIDDYGFDPSQVIDGDHILADHTNFLTQFLWHMTRPPYLLATR